MFKKLAVSLAIMLSAILIILINVAPIFSGYANSFEIYHGDSAGQIRTVSYIEYFLSGKIKGEGVTLKKENFDLDDFLRDFKAKIKVCENIEGGVNYYAYSRKIPYRQKIYGKTVNLQIFVGEQTVKVGAPMIYGSF